MKKILYWVNPTTKELRYSKEIDTASLGNNTPNTTEKEPLKVKEGFAICFISNSWEYVEDNRDKYIHNIETKEDSICNYLGEIKTGFTLGKYEKSISELLSEAKIIQIIQINTTCGKEITSGFTSSSLEDNLLYESEVEDQTNLAGMKDRGTSLPLKCSSNGVDAFEWKVHTTAQLKEVFDDGVDFKLALLVKAAQLKDLVSKASTIEELDLISWED